MSKYKWLFSVVLLLALVGLAGIGELVHAQSLSNPVSLQAPPHASPKVLPASPLTCGFNQVSSPNPTPSYNHLSAVAVGSENDVWAVGDTTTSTTGLNPSTLVERWNGSVWSITPSANTNVNNNILNAVAVISANDVWAVGIDYSTGGIFNALTEHWNGSAWTIVPIPNTIPPIVILYGVAAAASNDVWAVGVDGFSTTSGFIIHWDGSAWSQVSTPTIDSPELDGITVRSASDAWAVGEYYTTNGGSSVGHTLTEHWNGSTWSIVTSPDLGAFRNTLKAVSIVSQNDAWAVGSYSNSYGTADQTLTEHWNGSTWIVVASPNANHYYDYLLGVAGSSANDVWAVGYYVIGGQVQQQQLVEHWNGTAWSIDSSPNPGPAYTDLVGVASSSANDVWAVGYYDTDSSYAALIERYTGGGICETPVPTSTPPRATATSTPTACTSFSDVQPDSPFYPFVTCLVGRGIISGYSDCTFRPNNNVTRAQLAKIVSNSAGFLEPQPNQLFQDVPLGSPYQLFIGRLASRGYIGGYACGGVGEPCVPPGNLPYFRPGNHATRGQISKIDSNAAGFSNMPVGQQSEDVPIGSTYYTFTYRLVSRSIMSGYPCGGMGEPCVPPANLPYFRPDRDATRGQTSKIVGNTFFPNCQNP